MQAYDLQHLPHVFNDLVNLDCDNIEDSIGIDYDKDSSIILNDGKILIYLVMNFL